MDETLKKKVTAQVPAKLKYSINLEYLDTICKLASRSKSSARPVLVS